MFVTQRMAVCTISDQNVKERSRKCEFKPFNFKTELSFSPHSLNWQHCAIEREYMNWSRSCDSFDQEFVSPNEDKRKCMSMWGEYMNWSRPCESIDQELVSPSEDNRKCVSQCEENLFLGFNKKSKWICRISDSQVNIANKMWFQNSAKTGLV